MFTVNFLQHATSVSQVYTYETNRTKLNRYVDLDYQAEGNQVFIYTYHFLSQKSAVLESYLQQ